MIIFTKNIAKLKNTVLYLGLLLLIACNQTVSSSHNKKLEAPVGIEEPAKQEPVIVGASRTDRYFELLRGLKTGVVSNHTGMVGPRHLVDTLLASGIEVVAIFCPEHGFRGTADAGAGIGDSLDEATGLPVISLYGKNKKPQPDQLQGIEIMLFDIQDVGARFYTYISTLHYVMEACAENSIPLIVLDRPNPNGHYVDGPVLDTANASFIGMHPVPVVHGMTMGEYARMIKGEKWIHKAGHCALTVVTCLNYTHATPYELPIPPSPNLPNSRAVMLYPTLCLLEGTCLSMGRGTDKQFQVMGHPLLKEWTKATFSFTPQPRPGASKPVLEGKLCYGFDFSQGCEPFVERSNELMLDILIETYRNFPDKKNFFNRSFRLLAGNNTLQQQIENGASEAEIRESWQPALNEFKELRKNYLLYDEE